LKKKRRRLRKMRKAASLCSYLILGKIMMRGIAAGLRAL
jgi:hypothetical protein